MNPRFLGSKSTYDGWNVAAILRRESPDDATNTNPFKVRAKLIWGQDLSGTYQGAGGVGGLQAIQCYSSSGVYHSTHAPAYDANGNIIGLIKIDGPNSTTVNGAAVTCANGQVSARYDYSPFGQPLIEESLYAIGTEPLAQFNPIRFSTKFTDDESGLVYYGYRYYSPEMGRWLNRDPIEERGGVNLYGMVGNDPVGRLDALGLTPRFDDPFEGGGPQDMNVTLEGDCKKGFRVRIQSDTSTMGPYAYKVRVPDSADFFDIQDPDDSDPFTRLKGMCSIKDESCSKSGNFVQRLNLEFNQNPSNPDSPWAPIPHTNDDGSRSKDNIIVRVKWSCDKNCAVTSKITYEDEK